MSPPRPTGPADIATGLGGAVGGDQRTLDGDRS